MRARVLSCLAADKKLSSRGRLQEGLSARTVGINAVCQIIIFFYLVDSETSMVVLGSAGAARRTASSGCQHAAHAQAGGRAWRARRARAEDDKQTSQLRTIESPHDDVHANLEACSRAAAAVHKLT